MSPFGEGGLEGGLRGGRRRGRGRGGRVEFSLLKHKYKSKRCWSFLCQGPTRMLNRVVLVPLDPLRAVRWDLVAVFGAESPAAIRSFRSCTLKASPNTMENVSNTSAGPSATHSLQHFLSLLSSSSLFFSLLFSSLLVSLLPLLSSSLFSLFSSLSSLLSSLFSSLLSRLSSLDQL